MKVLLISSNSGSIGGGERYLVYLANGLVAAGHQVEAIVSNIGEMDELALQLIKEHVALHRLRLLGLKHRRLRFIAALLDIGQQKRLAALIHSLAPDVVHINQQYDEDGLDYLRAALRSGVPVVGTIHLPMCNGKLNRPLGRVRTLFIKWFYLRHPYEKVFVSRDTQEEFCRFYGSHHNTHVVRNGIPLRSLNYSDIVGRASSIVVGAMGKLIEQKNPLLLLRAFALLLKKRPNAKLIFVGDGPERARIEQSANDLGIAPCITITGWLSEPETWWRQFSVFAMSSKFEGMSLALIEAAVRGIPSVVTATHGVEEVSECAPWVTVVPRGDVDRLTEGLLTSLETPRPAAEQLRFAQDEFSCQRMADETIDVYAKARTSQNGAQSTLRFGRSGGA